MHRVSEWIDQQEGAVGQGATGRGSRTIRVARGGHYKVTLQVVAERGGNICESDVTSTTIWVFALPDPSPSPEPTEDPTPDPTEDPTPDPTEPPTNPPANPDPTDEPGSPTPVPTVASTATPTPAPTPPGKPTWSAYSHATTTSITPRWNAPTAGTNSIDGYNLSYRVDGTNNWTIRNNVSTKNIGGDIATTVSSLSSNTNYEVRVQAFDTAGIKGNWSGIKHIRTARIKPVAPPTPNTPSWFKGRPNGSQFTYNDKGNITSATVGMELSWELVSGSGISYRVQQFTGVNQWSTLTTVTGTSVIARGLLPESTYIFRVQAQREGGPGVGTLSSGWNQQTVSTPTPFNGHQADHTVQYRIETPPTSDHVPDFSAGIATGASAWNTAAGDGFTICKVGSCGNKNLDRRTTTIKFPSGADRSVFTVSPIHNDCRSSFACVSTTYASDGHVTSQEVRFEEPAWEAEGGSEFSPPDHRRKVWTNNFALHARDVKVSGVSAKYVYLPWVAMHEFGHTFGLMDLYDLPFGNYGGYLMFEEDRAVQSVPQSDVDYLKDVYRNHSPHGR